MKRKGTKYPSSYVKASRYNGYDEWDGWVEPELILNKSNVPNIKEAKKLSSYIQDMEYTSGFATVDRFLDYFNLDDIYQEMLEES